VPDEHARGLGDPPASGHTGGSEAQAGGGSTQGGRESGSRDNSEQPPLFGAGVAPETGDRHGDGQEGAREGSARSSGGGADSVLRTAPAATRTSSAAGFGWFALIGVAVALAGGGLAYLLGRRARGGTP
jgi:hypothetical protein